MYNLQSCSLSLFFFSLPSSSPSSSFSLYLLGFPLSTSLPFSLHILYLSLSFSSMIDGTMYMQTLPNGTCVMSTAAAYRNHLNGRPSDLVYLEVDADTIKSQCALPGAHYRMFENQKGDSVVTKAAASERRCLVCERTGAGVKLVWCSKCRQVTYCGVACQRQDYKVHKTRCTDYLAARNDAKPRWMAKKQQRKENHKRKKEEDRQRQKKDRQRKKEEREGKKQ